MKITKTLTHVTTDVLFEKAQREEELIHAIEEAGLEGYAAELDIAERTEDHVQMLSLAALLKFAKANGVGAVAYDVTYFPHADRAEVDSQINAMARDLEISAEVIRSLCSKEVAEYLALDAERDASIPVHSIVEAYVGGTALAWYGINEYPRLKRIILSKLAEGGSDAQRSFVERAAKMQVELI